MLSSHSLHSYPYPVRVTLYHWPFVWHLHPKTMMFYCTQSTILLSSNVLCTYAKLFETQVTIHTAYSIFPFFGSFIHPGNVCTPCGLNLPPFDFLSLTYDSMAYGTIQWHYLTSHCPVDSLKH